MVKRSRKPGTSENLILAQKVTCQNHGFVQFDISDAWKCQKRCCWSFWYAFLAP